MLLAVFGDTDAEIIMQPCHRPERMNIAERLRTKIRNSADLTPQVRGLWRPIQMCLDDNAGEFLNVGVVFSYGGKTQVRMMDSFERLRCLYGRRVDTNELQHLLQDVAETLIQCQAELPDDLSENIRLGAPLYAAGLSPEAVLDSLFKDVVAIARERGGPASFPLSVLS